MKKRHRAKEKFEQLLMQGQVIYENNCDEAWRQIRRLFSHPWRWVLGIVGVLLLCVLCVGVYFLSIVRAPDLPEPDSSQDGEEIQWDDYNLEVPITASGREEGVYTFLLLGTDVGGGNTDTIMVVSYDVVNQDFNMMSIPRDTMVNVSWDIKKINSVYSVYGMDGLKEHVGKLIGFEPDYYIKINVQAFVEVIDLLGGVYFDVPRRMEYKDPAQNLYIDLEPGYQLLDGYNAMGLVRWRHNNDYTLGYNDEDRMKTQQAFLKAAAEQCLSLKNWTKISGLIDVFYTYVESDLSIGEMLWFAQQASGFGTGKEGLNATDILTFTMPGNYAASAWSRTYRNYQSYVTVNASELLEIVNEYFNPYQGNITAGRLDIMRINADGSVASSTGSTADSKAAKAPTTSSQTGENKPSQENPPAQENPPEATAGNLTVAAS